MTSTLDPAVMLGGRYRLIERAAVGGQGEVWRAEDTGLGRPVAVKVLRGEYADSAEFRDRFRLEAQHAAGLSHPGVAQVFDYDEGRDDTLPYLVMEYVEGESLSATIAREAPLGPERVLDVIAAAASALAVAHAAGLVHRDVKPGNLLVGLDGAIKITDFGIARAVDAIPLTRTGMLLGTPLYISPEQACGRPATAAGDLYALGVIAYEMLTGVPPFQGPATAVLVAHRDAPFPALPPSAPAGLRDLVLALTAKDPAMRPPGAAAVVDQVGRLRAEPGMTRPADTRMDGVVPVVSPVGGVTQVLALPAGPSRSSDLVPRHRRVSAVLAAGPVPGRRRVLPLAVAGLVIALLGGCIGWLARPTAPSGPVEPAVTPMVSHSSPGTARHAPATRRKPVQRLKRHTKSRTRSHHRKRRKHRH